MTQALHPPGRLAWPACLLLATACLGPTACAQQAGPEAEGRLNQNLRLLAPAKPGSTAIFRLHGPGMEGALWQLTEASRQEEGPALRLAMRQSLIEASGARHENTGAAWFFHFEPGRLAWGLADEPDAMVALTPLRLGAPPPEPQLASLSAIQPLDLPYGRIPWAAAFWRAGPQPEQASTSWFAPGMGLVLHERRSRGEPLERAELAVWLLP